MPIDPSTAFVSYSREDLEFVRRLVKDLKAKGAKVWMDKIDILPGQPWDDKVEIAVERCERMIVVLSPPSVASAKVKNEFMDALDLGKTVIPVLFRECKIPQQLKRLQYADFREHYDTGLAELLASLTALEEAAESPIASQARLEEESTRAAGLSEQVQLEEEEFERQRIATGLVRREEERKQAVAEQARLDQEEHERRVAAEKAGQEELERQRIAAEQARLKKERRQASTEQVRLEEVHQNDARSKDVQLAGFHGSASPQTDGDAVIKFRLRRGLLTGIFLIATVGTLVWVVNNRGKQGGGSRPPEVNATQQQEAQPQANASNAMVNPPSSAAPSAASIPAGLSAEVADSYRKAEAGDSDAMALLGHAYDTGTGAPQDAQASLYWNRKAADTGNTSGMVNLGLMYKSGHGVQKNYEQAVSWFRKAADTGNASGMANLGLMYESGYGVPKDYEQAVSWFRKGADAGDGYAMEGLSRMYESGQGVPQDKQQAEYWHRKGLQKLIIENMR